MKISEIDPQLTLTKTTTLFPHEYMDESYEIDLPAEISDQIRITSNTIWGAIRGLETVKQMLFWQENVDLPYMFNLETLIDSPNYAYRGYMLDTARHFIKKEKLYQILDAISYHKFNVFHWHMVDDQSFPFESQTYPELHQNGAYPPRDRHFYSVQDLTDIVIFARNRGIRIIPEFDTPGHTKSWCKSLPGFCPPCTQLGISWGPVDPSKEENYARIENIWSDVANIFPDNYIHLGGDEVDYKCWQLDDEISKWAEDMGFSKRDPKQMFTYFENRVYEIADKIGKKTIVWDEVLEDGSEDDNLLDAKKPIVEVWRPWGPGTKSGWETAMETATAKNYKAILATTWYLDLVTYDVEVAFGRFYLTDPKKFNGTAAQKDRVLGGETAYFMEYSDGSNFVASSFPRASAVAERLWSEDIQRILLRKSN